MTSNHFDDFDDFLYDLEQDFSFQDSKKKQPEPQKKLPPPPRSRLMKKKAPPQKSSGSRSGRSQPQQKRPPASSGGRAGKGQPPRQKAPSGGSARGSRTPPPPRKGAVRRDLPAVRERARRSPALTYLIFVVAISLILATLLWTAANDVLALNKDDGMATIVIEEHDTIRSVAKQLHDMGVIKHTHLFMIYGRHTDAIDKIIPGTYELRTDLDYRAIVAAMSYNSGQRQVVTITIPEGYTLEQIFHLLEENGVCSYDSLMQTAATHDYAFSFLADLPLGDAHRLEGYLYPDTYDFYKGQSALYAINKMLVNFDSRVTDQMRQRAGEMGYSVHEIVIIASIIERETTGLDQANIASVIYNRLNSTYMRYLQIDATVRYALDDWTNPLTYEDLTVESPYNTYIYPGLPAGPISNPGYAAINAALNPASTNYYFYALANDGTHRFFQSQDSFNHFLASSEAAAQ